MTMEGFIKGLVVGGVAGVVAGILYAPKSGKEMRQQIYDSAEKMLKKAEDMAAHQKEVYVEKKDKLKRAVEAGVDAYKKDKEELQPLKTMSPY